MAATPALPQPCKCCINLKTRSQRTSCAACTATTCAHWRNRRIVDTAMFSNNTAARAHQAQAAPPHAQPEMYADNCVWQQMPWGLQAPDLTTASNCQHTQSCRQCIAHHMQQHLKLATNWLNERPPLPSAHLAAQAAGCVLCCCC